MIVIVGIVILGVIAIAGIIAGIAFRSGRTLIAAAAAVALLVGTFALGIHTVQARQVAIVQEFGKPVDVWGPGGHYAAPWKDVTTFSGTIQTLKLFGGGGSKRETDNVRTDNKITVQLSDRSAASVNATLQWQINVPESLASSGPLSTTTPTVPATPSTTPSAPPAVAPAQTDAEKQATALRAEEDVKRLFVSYREPERVDEDYVEAQLRDVVYQRFEAFDPLAFFTAADPDQIARFTPGAQAAPVLDALNARLTAQTGTAIRLVSLTITGIEYSKETQDRINQRQQASADLANAELRRQKAIKEAESATALGKGYDDCVSATVLMLDKGYTLPTYWSCFGAPPAVLPGR